MRLLLDTHVWLWMVADPDRLGPRTTRQLADRRNSVLLSAASSWEIGIKHRLGKLVLPEPPSSYVPDRMRRTGVTGLVVEHAHALASAELPPHHRDPFDRLLVAQARLERARLVTVDEQLGAYDVTLVDARR